MYYYPDYLQVNYPYGGIYPQQEMAPSLPSGPISPGAGLTMGEESYIENILRFNRGKIGTFYLTYENNSQWNAKVFRGMIETAGRDHLIISDPQTGKRYLLLMVNLDYVEFDEPLNYIPPKISPALQSEFVTR